MTVEVGREGLSPSFYFGYHCCSIIIYPLSRVTMNPLWAPLKRMDLFVPTPLTKAIAALKLTFDPAGG